MGRKNVLVSAYFAKNVGDDLFLKVLFDRYENVNWYLLTPNDEYEKIFDNYAHVKTIKLYREYGQTNLFVMWSKITNHFKHYDAFVMIGGSIFMQNKQWKNTLSIRNKIINLLNKYHIPAYVIGANFGPYDDDSFITMNEDHFINYENICFRDSYSYTKFKHLSNVSVAPDAVLTLQAENARKRQNCIGISPISLQERKDLQDYAAPYYLKLKQMIKYYVEQGNKIRLFSFCEYEGDLRSIKEILSLLPSEYNKEIEVVKYNGQLDSFLEQFQVCSKIIGTRFHSLILAMIFQQPFLPISYSDKTVRGLRQIGIKHLGYHIREIDLLDFATLESKFNGIVKQEVYLEAEKQFYNLDQLLNKRKI